MKFKQAVESATPPLNAAYRQGLQALAAHSRKIRSDNGEFTGSVDLDGTLIQVRQFSSANRWDYGIGYKPARKHECAIWVEVHGAKDKEVGTMTRKVKWLKEYLKSHAPDLWSMTLAAPEGIRFVWLGTRNVHMPKHSPAYRRAAQEGISLPGTVLILP